MHIQNSILAGEILTILESASCSIRIIDIETVLRINKCEVFLAIAKLLSEDLIVLIKEGERSAIALNKSVKICDFEIIENNMPELPFRKEQVIGAMAYNMASGKVVHMN